MKNARLHQSDVSLNGVITPLSMSSLLVLDLALALYLNVFCDGWGDQGVDHECDALGLGG